MRLIDRRLSGNNDKMCSFGSSHYQEAWKYFFWKFKKSKLICYLIGSNGGFLCSISGALDLMKWKDFELMNWRTKVRSWKTQESNFFSSFDQESSYITWMRDMLKSIIWCFLMTIHGYFGLWLIFWVKCRLKDPKVRKWEFSRHDYGP